MALGSQTKDRWSSSAYSAAANFVPKLAHKILHHLDPQPTDRVLDIGCGDGIFTSDFAPKVAETLGIDASPSMIEAASKAYNAPNVNFKVVDCRYLGHETDIADGQWDKIISNAALHWILRDPSTRQNVLQACHAALKPGGLFVFEMGGAGNVAEVYAALVGALMRQGGLTVSQAHAANPWFFPSDAWMRQALQEVGFKVRFLESEYRPTKLTAGEQRSSGLEGWLRLMAAAMLDVLDGEDRKDAVVREVCDVLGPAITREDGEYVGYVRLRAVAQKRAAHMTSDK